MSKAWAWASPLHPTSHAGPAGGHHWVPGCQNMTRSAMSKEASTGLSVQGPQQLRLPPHPPPVAAHPSSSSQVCKHFPERIFWLYLSWRVLLLLLLGQGLCLSCMVPGHCPPYLAETPTSSGQVPSPACAHLFGPVLLGSHAMRIVCFYSLLPPGVRLVPFISLRGLAP